CVSRLIVVFMLFYVHVMYVYCPIVVVDPLENEMAHLKGLFQMKTFPTTFPSLQQDTPHTHTHTQHHTTTHTHTHPLNSHNPPISHLLLSPLCPAAHWL